MRKFGLASAFAVTDSEYRANLAGMNTFFGAVLGFVLADVAVVNLREFAQLLMFTAAIVIGILYVSASKQRWLYAAFNLIFIWFLPRLLSNDAGDPGRLQVTLATWAVMTMLLEGLWSWQQRRDTKHSEVAP
jgi:hypothetical protein